MSQPTAPPVKQSQCTFPTDFTLPAARPRGRVVGGAGAVLRELWAYRDLLLNLVRRDLSVRYKRSALGFLWSFLNPLLMMLVFTIVFMVVKPQSVRSYPLFVLAGLLPWNYMAGSLSGAVRSITSNANLIDKVYFPREVLPLSVVLANLVNFLLSLAVFLPIAALLGADLSVWTLALPLIVVVQLLLVAGLALLLSALNVAYRDTELVLDVALTAWFFLTPIFYELELLPNRVLGIDVWRFVYTLNPMATLVTDYRYITLYHYPVIKHTLVSLAQAVLLLVVGWAYFRRKAPSFAEEV
ncbi:MAG: ABC transporter permease [Chloroflexi bacterium]|nr:ABC transporter permease [Chloroflexota bacterium]